MNTGFVTTNIVLALIMTIVSHPKIQESNPRSGLLQSAIIAFYYTFSSNGGSNKNFKMYMMKKSKAKELDPKII